jgi:hypothetical protein
MIYILSTSPISIIKVGKDIETALSKYTNIKLITGYFNPHDIYDNVIIVGNPDSHARLLYDNIKNNPKIKNIILYLVCEGILDINQVSWLRNIKGYIITPSKYVKQKFECTGINIDNIIPHGVNNYGNIKQKNNILGYVSGYQKRKYPSYLYPKFYNYIRDKNFRIITNDINPYAKYFPKVIYSNYKLPYEKILEFYTNINFYVNLSDSEGFGLTPLEALAHGNVTILPKLPVFTEFYPSNIVFYFNITDKKEYEPFSFEHIEHFVYDVDDLIEKLEIALNMDNNTYQSYSSKSIEFAKKYNIFNTYSKFLEYL